MAIEVYITQTAAYLPLEPVANDAMEAVLGWVGGKPSRARRLVLRSNGITSRHYALDRDSGWPVMSNAEMAARAIRKLGAIGRVDSLAAATSRPDQLMPGHGVMVHGHLAWPRLEVVSLAGICVAGAAALKHAWLSIRAGTAQRSVAVASELASPGLHARNFEAEVEHKIQALEQRPEIAFEKDFLRWMLSDGAGAFLLEDAPRAPLSLKIHWVELSSAAHALDTCMYSGAEKLPNGELRGWQNYSSAYCAEHSVFAVKQDVKLLNEHVIRATLIEPLRDLVEKYQLRPHAIDWFLPHMSSYYFAQPVADGLVQAGLPLATEKWFTNLAQCGNTGSASPYIMLDALRRSARLQSGQRVLMYIPESGRFSSGFVLLEAV